MNRNILLSCAWVVLIVPKVALAESVSLDQVREMVDRQEYEEAQNTLATILEAGNLGPTQIVEVYRAQAECSAALRQPDAATDAFVRLLAVNPDFYVSSSESPLLREPFEQAQAYWTEHSRPSPSFEPPRAVPPGQPLALSVRLDAQELPDLFADIRVHFRTDSSDSAFTTLEAEGGQVEIPAGRLEGAEAVEVHVSVHDEYGNVVARIGSPDEPLRVVVGDDPGDGGTGDGRPRRRIYQRWWFWTIIGAAVVGLAVGLPLGLMQTEVDDPCEATIGSECDLVVDLGN